MKNLSDWRSVRVWELGLERELRQRHVLGVHGFLIGLTVLGVMWLTSFVQFAVFHSHSLALRYLITLGIGYVSYLIVVRIWAAALLRRESGSFDLPFDGWGSGHSPAAPDVSASPGQMFSGGGGDFGGGGASGHFASADLPAADSVDLGSVAGEVASGAVQVAAAADEGAVVVVVPVVVVFLVGLAILFGAGASLFLYFGWDVLLAVAVEVAFSYVSGRTAVRVVREGWVSAAVRLTWKPLLGAILAAVLLGGLVDVFVPSANSLPQAIKAIRSADWR
jgi:uncharacterized membrane protein YgcG